MIIVKREGNPIQRFDSQGQPHRGGVPTPIKIQPDGSHKMYRVMIIMTNEGRQVEGIFQGGSFRELTFEEEMAILRYERVRRLTTVQMN